MQYRISLAAFFMSGVLFMGCTTDETAANGCSDDTECRSDKICNSKGKCVPYDPSGSGAGGGGSTSSSSGGAVCALGGLSCATLTCCAGICNNGTCACTAAAGNCQNAEDCCSGVCTSGLCAPCNSVGGLCQTDANCCSAICEGSGVCACAPLNSGCNDGAACCSGSCQNGACVCATPGSTCAADAECCGRCTNGVCCGVVGTQCSSSGDCCEGEGNCVNGQCALPLVLTSSAFTKGGVIPDKFACYDANFSPELSWTGGPSSALSYAVTFTELSLSDGTPYVWNWAIWDIPAGVHSLPEHVETGYQPADPAGAKQGIPDYDSVNRYLGPCASGSAGPFTYRFKVYALDIAILNGVDVSTSDQEVSSTIESSGHVLTSASLYGTNAGSP